MTPRRVGLVVLLVILAGFLAAGASVLWSSPLAHSVTTWCCAGQPEDGTTPMIGGELVNDGRLTVRVTGVEVPPWIEVRIDLVESGEAEVDIRGARPFAPFTLPPGQERWLTFLAEREQCERRDGFARPFERATIRFEILGIGREQSLSVASPEGERLALFETDGCTTLGTG